MIETMQRAKTLVTTGTAPPQIPVRHDIPQEAVFRIGCDLLEAPLTAILVLGPARASIKTKSTRAKKPTRTALALPSAKFSILRRGLCGAWGHRFW
jgi:hypothetical protein